MDYRYIKHRDTSGGTSHQVCDDNHVLALAESAATAHMLVEMLSRQKKYVDALFKIGESDSSEFTDAHRGLVRIARDALRDYKE